LIEIYLNFQKFFFSIILRILIMSLSTVPPPYHSSLHLTAAPVPPIRRTDCVLTAVCVQPIYLYVPVYTFNEIIYSVRVYNSPNNALRVMATQLARHAGQRFCIKTSFFLSIFFSLIYLFFLFPPTPISYLCCGLLKYYAASCIILLWRRRHFSIFART